MNEGPRVRERGQQDAARHGPVCGTVANEAELVCVFLFHAADSDQEAVGRFLLASYHGLDAFVDSSDIAQLVKVRPSVNATGGHIDVQVLEA